MARVTQPGVCWNIPLLLIFMVGALVLFRSGLSVNGKSSRSEFTVFVFRCTSFPLAQSGASPSLRIM
eukprot:1315896-Amorphochlora_amoeboformis.AAC.1